MADRAASALIPDLPADFVDLTDSTAFRIDLRYATANNFTGVPVYGDLDRLILHPLAAGKLLAAAALLARRRPDLTLLVLDGLRPNRVQRLFWAAVAGTARQRYVGDPAAGSVHGFGLAVDVTLASREAGELDMGTAFDDFTEKAEPRREDEFLSSGDLTPGQVAARRLLRTVMLDAGFWTIPIEWWHFDALPPDEVRANYRLVE